MRAYFLTIVSVVLVCLPARAEEPVQVSMLDGMCSVIAPDSWKVTTDDLYKATIFSDAPDSGCSLVIAPPNPVLNANQLASMELVSLSLALGGQEVIEAVIGEFKGRMRMRVHFCAPLGDDFLVGLMHLTYVGEYVVMATATAPDGKFDDFIAIAENVMNSYEIDEDKMTAQSEELREIGEKLKNDTIKEFLGPGASGDAVGKYVIEDHIEHILKSELRKAG